MAKFLAELLGCTLPEKGASPIFEVRSKCVLTCSNQVVEEQVMLRLVEAAVC